MPDDSSDEEGTTMGPESFVHCTPSAEFAMPIDENWGLAMSPPPLAAETHMHTTCRTKEEVPQHDLSVLVGLSGGRGRTTGRI